MSWGPKGFSCWIDMTRWKTRMWLKRNGKQLTNWKRMIQCTLKDILQTVSRIWILLFLTTITGMSCSDYINMLDVALWCYLLTRVEWQWRWRGRNIWKSVTTYTERWELRCTRGWEGTLPVNTVTGFVDALQDRKDLVWLTRVCRRSHTQ